MQENNPIPPQLEDFSSKQITLFRDLLCNTEEERDSLSNLMDLWDSIPKYTISRQQQDKWRKSGNFPPLYDIHFHYRGKKLKVEIQPAAIRLKDGSVKSYYPSANEELIEDVLRKFAAEQTNGYFNASQKRSGVVFTLYMLRQELAKRGHARTYKDIDLSLQILGRSVITTTMLEENKGEFSSNSLYLNNMFRASKIKLSEDPGAKCFADFHPFATRSLDDLTYRQFNYVRLLMHRSQLARWLNRVLCLKYLNASPVHPFEIRFSTIQRDSGLLDGYIRLRAAIDKLDEAFEELESCQPPILSGKPDKKVIEGKRGKIIDVVYRLQPSRSFIGEVKSASKRQRLALEG